MCEGDRCLSHRDIAKTSHYCVYSSQMIRIGTRKWWWWWHCKTSNSCFTNLPNFQKWPPSIYMMQCYSERGKRRKSYVRSIREYDTMWYEHDTDTVCTYSTYILLYAHICSSFIYSLARLPHQAKWKRISNMDFNLTAMPSVFVTVANWYWRYDKNCLSVVSSSLLQFFMSDEQKLQCAHVVFLLFFGLLPLLKSIWWTNNYFLFSSSLSVMIWWCIWLNKSNLQYLIWMQICVLDLNLC